ncbi:MAG: 2-oxoglutarate dehydrogenase complex dihydrolipoyllysine-residue succinyltransferase [Pseudomonadota bacterium]
MPIEVKAPNFPESVTDGTLVTWHKQPGDAVSAEEVLADVETDKVVFEIPAPQDGVLEKILVPVGAKVLSGQVLAHLGKGTGVKPAKPSAETQPAAAEPATAPVEDLITPSAKKLIAEKGLDARRITGSGKDGRILKEDVLSYLEHPPAPSTSQPVRAPATPAAVLGARMEKRVPMTRLRQRIAERLVEAQQTAAILTTFNEVNMQPILTLRDKYKDLFEKQHDTRLGFMSFFVKAAIEALKRFPEVNAAIDGSDIVYHGYYDIGIAVGSPRGLVVPVLRDADQLSIAEIEAAIRDFGARAKDGKLSLDEITGGTFSITNGGVFGSLLSTPILNPPQSAILGMHKVQDRPMAENGQVVIRPMMYLALSYDHRIIDGREAVQFLVTIKEQLEDPARMLLGV